MDDKNLGVAAGAAPLVAGHTPIPWRVEDGTHLIWSDNAYDPGTNCVGCVVARGAQPFSWKGSRPTADEQDANVAFIVRACNSHDDLLSALEEIVDYRGGAANALEDEYVMERVNAAVAKARA